MCFQALKNKTKLAFGYKTKLNIFSKSKSITSLYCNYTTTTSIAFGEWNNIPLYFYPFSFIHMQNNFPHIVYLTQKCKLKNENIEVLKTEFLMGT